MSYKPKIVACLPTLEYTKR